MYVTCFKGGVVWGTPVPHTTTSCEPGEITISGSVTEDEEYTIILSPLEMRLALAAYDKYITSN
jgi:hypothetical protein